MSAGFDEFWGKVEHRLDASLARRRRRAALVAGSTLLVSVAAFALVVRPGSVDEDGFTPRGRQDETAGTFSARYFESRVGGGARELRVGEPLPGDAAGPLVLAVSSASPAKAFVTVATVDHEGLHWGGESVAVEANARDLILPERLGPPQPGARVLLVFTNEPLADVLRADIGPLLEAGKTPSNVLEVVSRDLGGGP